MTIGRELLSGQRVKAVSLDGKSEVVGIVQGYYLDGIYLGDFNNKTSIWLLLEGFHFSPLLDPQPSKRALKAAEEMGFGYAPARHEAALVLDRHVKEWAEDS